MGNTQTYSETSVQVALAVNSTVLSIVNLKRTEMYFIFYFLIDWLIENLCDELCCWINTAVLKEVATLCQSVKLRLTLL